MKNNFCVLPFIKFSVENNGEVIACCESSEKLGNSKVSSVMEIWNSDKWKDFRQQFINGEQPSGCNHCWNMEKNGVQSYRQIMNGGFSKWLNESDISAEMKIPPKILTLKMSNLCNLACRMCVPAASTTLGNKWNKNLFTITEIHPEGYSANFNDVPALVEELKTLGPYLEQLSLTGGEPLMDPQVVEVLQALQPFAHNMEFFANTNMTKVMHGKLNILDLIKPFRTKILSVSVDGPPLINEYIRVGTDSKIVENNTQFVHSLGIEIHNNIAVQAINVIYLPETIEYIIKKFNPHWITASFATAGKGNAYFDMRALPPALKEKIVKKLTDYLTNFSTDVSDHIKINVTDIITRVCKFIVSDDYHNQKNWYTMKAYYDELDQIHNTNLLNTFPELKEYWE